MVDNKMTDIDIDKIIEKLTDVRGSKPGKLVNLLEKELMGLIVKSREIFISQPVLLELEAPIKICGRKKLKKNIYLHPLIIRE